MRLLVLNQAVFDDVFFWKTTVNWQLSVLFLVIANQLKL